MWAENIKIQNLMFSNKWVKNFLDRGKMTRRLITKEDKNVPSDEEILRVLGIGQKLYIEKQHEPRTCFNFDETAITYASGPKKVYCPKDQSRATHLGVSDSKVRITATIAVNAEGVFAPTMFIIKHSASSEDKPDQTTMKVIPELHKKEGFTVNDGWELHTYEKRLTIKNKNDLHKVKYLIHTVTGHVITSQVKAWNDTVRMCMWFKLIVLPIKNNLGKMFIWCDNCGSHLTQAVKDVIVECNIDVAFLPKNMTGELQVLDLVVNGPLKAHIRNKRATRLYNAFQEYKAKRVIDDKLKFVPPKPSMIEGIKDLILLFAEQFTEEKFKDCINRTFIKTGTLPIPTSDITELPQFITFKRLAACGTMSIVPSGTIDLSNPVDSNTTSREELSEEREVETALFDYTSVNDINAEDIMSDCEED
jgi:DDE superfamily endonuclease